MTGDDFAQKADGIPWKIVKAGIKLIVRELKFLIYAESVTRSRITFLYLYYCFSCHLWQVGALQELDLLATLPVASDEINFEVSQSAIKTNQPLKKGHEHLFLKHRRREQTTQRCSASYSRARGLFELLKLYRSPDRILVSRTGMKFIRVDLLLWFGKTHLASDNVPPLAIGAVD